MQQWVKRMGNSIGVQISQSARREKRTASAEVGTILGPVNPPLHQHRVWVQGQERRFTTICSRNWFTIPPFFFFGMAVSRPKCNNKLSSVLGGWQ